MKSFRKRWVIWLGLGLVLVCLVLQLSKHKQPVTNPPPGKIAFVSDRSGSDQIYVMDTDGSNQIPLTEDLDSASAPTWSPDGRHIAFSAERDGEGGLWVMETDGSNKVYLSSPYEVPIWSLDSTHILFRSRRAGSGYSDLYVVDREGSNIVCLTNSLEGGGGEDVAWSPDSTHLAFQSKQDGNWEIYVIDRDGSDLVNLSDHSADDVSFAWSPDGAYIAFKSRRDGNGEIYVVDRDGSSPVNLTNHPAYDGMPAWSPDGARIAFRSDRTGSGGTEGGLYIMNSDGTDVQHLGLGGGNPLWSPDGGRIMHKWGGTLYTTDVEGTSQTRLSPGLGRSFFRVSWSPDGEHVAFVELGSFPPETDVTAPWTYFGVASMRVPRRVTLGKSSREDSWPHSWSPDGQYLVFSKGKGNEIELFIVSGDGRRLSQLTHNSHWDGQPAWQPQVP